ncbi:proline-rich protein PRCC [Astyanax mexicanus]|uniref:proline-rich protein PRCC n=1 Tax=Astyanax mexicanus TaxID=7994 RepID=UPI0020CB5E75|nr:proline-rich protein PRCC [Astyanax mexicanus]
MSLVCYDSSDESDRDEAPSPAAARPEQSRGPPAPPPAERKLVLDLPKPKKRGEPVKISVPEINAASSDSDEDEPVRKKAGISGGGLSSMLPQPKNLVLKETQRPLVPHTLTKRPAPAPQSKGTKPGSQAQSGTSPSPSAIKAAAKSAALQLARQMAADEEGSDDELAPENYFSLAESSTQPLAAAYPDTQLYTPSLNSPPSIEDAPLDFGSKAEPQNKPTWAAHDFQRGDYQTQSQEQQDASSELCAQDYYSEGYYQDQGAEFIEEEPGSSTLFNDEAFRRLQGKQNRGKEEIKFLEIKGDDQLSGNQQWMTKNMSAETEPRKSFSKKKGDQPTGQQRRKHQITYLIHQAKERELELKNNWADNKVSRRQTQAKYGF